MVSTLIAEWAISTFADNARLIGAVPVVLALGLMIFSHRQRRESLKEIGFRVDNFWPAVRLLLLPTLLALVIIAGGSWLMRNGVASRPVRIRLAFIPLWALFQQYALQGYVNRRAQIGASQGAIAAIIVAAVFAVLHLPSPLLASLAFAGGFVWASVYQRHPNLLALALSHTVVSWALSLTIPDNLTRHLRIGFKYFGLDV
jgi:membrane protease YdiL (CAAX protease family)